MEIELKNGETLILEVSSLILEYIEDYKGGIEQLRKDANGRKRYKWIYEDYVCYKSIIICNDSF